jgi:hypothetical protein
MSFQPGLGGAWLADPTLGDGPDGEPAATSWIDAAHSDTELGDHERGAARLVEPTPQPSSGFRTTRASSRSRAPAAGDARTGAAGPC